MQTEQTASVLPLETIINAVNCLYNPNTNQEARKEADVYLNQLKENLHASAFEGLAVAFLQVLRSNAEGKSATEYFLLSAFESCFQKWLHNVVVANPEVDIRDLVEKHIKPNLWQFVVTSIGQQGEKIPSYLKNRIVSLFSYVSLRTWPQYWPSFFDDLVALSHSNAEYMEFVLLILTQVSEDLVSTKTDIDSARKDELIRSLDVCLPFLVQFIQHVLNVCQSTIASPHLQTSETEHAVSICILGLSFIESVLQICDLKVLWNTNILQTLASIFTNFSDNRIRTSIVSCFTLVYSREDCSDDSHFDERKFCCLFFFENALKLKGSSLIKSLKLFQVPDGSSDENDFLDSFFIAFLDCFRLHHSMIDHFNDENLHNFFYLIMLLVLHPSSRVSLSAVRFLRSYLRVSSMDKVESFWEWSMRVLVFRFICSWLQEKLGEISVILSSMEQGEEVSLSFSLCSDDYSQSSEEVYVLHCLRDNILGCLSMLVERDSLKVLYFLFSYLYERLLSTALNETRPYNPKVVSICLLDEFFSWDFKDLPCIYGATKQAFESNSNLIIILEALESVFVFVSNRMKKLRNLESNQSLFHFYERVYETCYQKAVPLDTYPVLFLNITRILACCLSVALVQSSKFSSYTISFLSRLLQEIGKCSYYGATAQLVLCRTSTCSIVVQLVKIPETAREVVPYIGEFTAQVQSLVANGNLTMNEQNLLAESIIVLSTALQNLQEQRTFIEGMLSSAVAEFGSDTWLQRIRSVNCFIDSFILNGHHFETVEGETIERRRKFSRLVSLLDAVSRGAREHSKVSSSHHVVSAGILAQIIEPLTILLSTLHELRTPASFSLLQSKGFEDILYPSAKDSCSLLGFTEEVGISPDDVLRRHGVQWPHPERDEIRFWLSDTLRRCYNLAGDIIRGIGEYEGSLGNFLCLMNALSSSFSDFDFRGLHLLLQHALRPLFSGFVPRSVLERLAETNFFLLFERLKERLDNVLGLEAPKEVSEEPEFNELIRDTCIHNTAKELFLVINDISITHSRCHSSFSKESNDWKGGYSNVSTKYYSIHDPLPVITETTSLYSIIFSLICRFMTWNNAYLQKKSKTLIEKLITVEMPTPAKDYLLRCLLYNLFYIFTQSAADSERKETALELLRLLWIKCPEQSISQLQSLFPNVQLSGPVGQKLMKERFALKIPRKGRNIVRYLLKEHFQIVIEEAASRGCCKVPSLPDKVHFQKIRRGQVLEEEEDDILSFWLD